MTSKEDKGIRQRLYETRLKARERTLEFKGIDVGALRKLEHEIDGDYGELAAVLQAELANRGGRVAERHKSSRQWAQAVLQAEVGSLAQAQTQKLPLQVCRCWPLFSASHVGTGSDPEIILPPEGGTGSGSVTWDSDCDGHPKVDVRGGGSGTTNSAELTCHCRFAFTPYSTHTFCIRPNVFMNGHFLVWSWGTCESAALGSARARLSLEVQVDQLSVPVKTVQHTIFDHVMTAGSDVESGFSYDSWIDGGASTSTVLLGGHEAVVWVKCTSFVEVVDYGRAWIDMQTSPNFYFQVPEVKWGPVLCSPWGMDYI